MGGATARCHCRIEQDGWLCRAVSVCSFTNYCFYIFVIIKLSPLSSFCYSYVGLDIQTDNFLTKFVTCFSVPEKVMSRDSACIKFLEKIL